MRTALIALFFGKLRSGVSGEGGWEKIAMGIIDCKPSSLAACPIRGARPLGLPKKLVNKMILVREESPGRPAFIRSVRDDALECGSLLRGFRRLDGQRPKRTWRTLPKLLAPDFRFCLPPRVFGRGRTRPDTGFFSQRARRKTSSSGRSGTRKVPHVLAQSPERFSSRRTRQATRKKARGRDAIRVLG